MKVLLLKSDHLGDFALSLPTFWQMVKELPQVGEMRILVHPANQEWSEILPWLPALEPIKHPRYDWGEPRLPLLWNLIRQMGRLRSERYDLGIDLTGTRGDRWGRWLLTLAGCRKVVAVERGGSLQDQHETRRIASKLPVEWGISGEASPVDFMRADLRNRTGQCILLAPAARTSAKSWPIERWAQLLRALPAERTRILIPPDADREKFKDLTAKSQHQNVYSILDTLQALRSASVVVALDTAVAHYAWLVGVPVVQLFAGTADPARWGTLAEGKMLSYPMNCAPCKQERCFRAQHECMTGVTMERVLAAIRDLVGNAELRAC